MLRNHNAQNKIIWQSWAGAFDVTGAAEFIRLAMTPGCDGPCTMYTAPLPPTELPVDPAQDEWLAVQFEGNATGLSGVPAGTVQDGISPFIDIAMAAPAAAHDPEGDQMWLDPEEWDIRCDYLAAGGDAPYYGCVFQNVWPEHVVVWVELPGHAEVITAGQNGGAPGAPGDAPLTRLMDETLKRKNGTEACKMWPSPRPPGEECDEYPFRSTWQGAHTGDPDLTFSDLIPTTENQDGGEQLAWFYRYHRVIDKDPFFVDVEA
ncbi:NucA/NucB deoxyribonuclease domain-containing protein [[Actinomadura] parvosata]|uniref:NucA/NucB deoxyribonuclease domain-containing protein n=1 Tax=[Actinomadura] parvosata TaxID=1955412 RepID=UPI00406CD1B8